MFGDSIYIKSYLRWVGWKSASRGDRLNFGSEQARTIRSVLVGANTVASDALRLGNLTMSSALSGLERAASARAISSDGSTCRQARTGDNVLFATR